MVQKLPSVLDQQAHGKRYCIYETKHGKPDLKYIPVRCWKSHCLLQWLYCFFTHSSNCYQ